MLSPSSYLFGYQQGQHSAERDQWAQDFKERLAGRRPVTIDQSYIDSLQAAQQQAQVAADHNYATGKQWMDHAQHLERDNADLKAENARLVALGERGLAMLHEMAGFRDTALREGEAKLRLERSQHKETADEKRLLVVFMRLLAHLTQAEKAEKTDNPDYRDLKLFAEALPMQIASGQWPSSFPAEIGAAWTRLRKALES
ncbi:hypothetical protein [Methylocella tundrae]|uniref:Uncharacterized protein n=1 Tax=Methylocella tundrae TaxID=227605 RepID=A0A4U8Z8Y2_METTU|nr:hypothetical protein [Methylocella tundrae]WPP02829.1 hypothetical protein SIN04_00530 [Methylocella tundrae]VFU17656.1 protein of unknown function [Methylocella tundrae]